METGITVTKNQIANLNNLPVMQLIKCLADNDNVELLMFESDLTVVKAMNSISINKLSRGIEKRNVVKAITYLILRLSENFNMKQKFTTEQASITALDLTEVLAYDTLEDVVLMFKYARQGKIGDGKDFKLDGQTILHKWVPEYLELKSIQRENEHNKKKGETNGMSTFNWSKEDIAKFEVNEKLILPTNLGQRLKQNLNVESKPDILLKSRKEYLTEMYYQVRNMNLEKLKEYLVKVDINNSKDSKKIAYDKDVYELVEKEIDKRNKK